MPKSAIQREGDYICAMSAIFSRYLNSGKYALTALFFCSFLCTSCAVRQQVTQSQLQGPDISALKYIGKYVIPNAFEFRKTTVGGLSGIDYDPFTDTYYMLSDDRSSINPARFYTAKIKLADTGIIDVKFNGVHFLKQQDGSIYPGARENIHKATDPEAIRFNPVHQNIVWSSEGERIIDHTDTVLVDPTITFSDLKGRFLNVIPLPENLRMQISESGPRRNGVLEGLSYANNFKELYASMEEPLYQDGSQAAFVPNAALVRIYRFDSDGKRRTAEFAYELDPIAHKPKTEKAEYNNGIPDLLWISGQKFLVTERSYTSDHRGTTIKIFLADFSDAEDIKEIPSLMKYPQVKKVSKKLLFNLEDLGIYVDNIEGATLGPVLSNGNRSLILIADNNFSKKQQAQVMLFEIIP